MRLVLDPSLLWTHCKSVSMDWLCICDTVTSNNYATVQSHTVVVRCYLHISIPRLEGYLRVLSSVESLFPLCAAGGCIQEVQEEGCQHVLACE